MIAFAAALLLRVAALGAQGGPGRGFGYDQSVYYAAADALIHGRLPYRDFHLLHPPLLMLLLTPFAALGTATHDTVGYYVANAVGLVVGALCAAVVVRIGRRLRYPVPAALAGGLLYAVAQGALVAEYSARLEPVANLALLLALLPIARPDDAPPPARRHGVWCGVALGAAVSTKIWYIAPALVVLVWLLARHPRRRSGWAAVAGMCGAGALINLPFFVAAPRRMFHMIVTAQVGRPVKGMSVLDKLASTLGFGQVVPAHTTPQIALTSLAVLAVVAMLVLGTRARYGVLFGSVTVVCVAVLVAAPSWFPYYGDFTVPGLALTVAAAWAGRAGTPARSLSASVARAAAAVTTVVAVAVSAAWFVQPDQHQDHGSINFPVGHVRAVLAGYRCVVTDDPEAAIFLGRLSSDFDRGCPDWVDVSGTSYWPNPYPYGTKARGQYWVLRQIRYFRSGDAALLVRTKPGPPVLLLRALAPGGLLLRGPQYHLYRTRR